MKRSEIKTGDVLYYDPQRDWETGQWGGGSKAVVVDTERYSIERSTWGIRRRVDYSLDPKGNAALVDLHRVAFDGTVQVERKAVPIAHLRGPWESTRAAVEQARAQRKAADDARSKATQDAAGLAAAAVERAKGLGLTLTMRGSSWRSGGTIEVVMDTETAAALLDAYEQQKG